MVLQWAAWQATAFSPNRWAARTAWLYGPGAGNFVKTILRRASEGVPLRAVNDQTGSPTYAPDLTECIDSLIRAGAEGVFHVTNSSGATCYELVGKAIAPVGIDATIEPRRSHTRNGMHSRDSHSTGTGLTFCSAKLRYCNP